MGLAALTGSPAAVLLGMAVFGTGFGLSTVLRAEGLGKKYRRRWALSDCRVNGGRSLSESAGTARSAGR